MSKETIYRQDAIDAIASYERDSTAPIDYRKIIEELPSAQPDTKELIAKIKNGISATNADDVYQCGMRNGMRWVLSLVDGKEPSYESARNAVDEYNRGWIEGREALREEIWEDDRDKLD